MLLSTICDGGQTIMLSTLHSTRYAAVLLCSAPLLQAVLSSQQVEPSLELK